MYLSYFCLLLLVFFQSLFSRYSVLSETYKLLYCTQSDSYLVSTLLYVHLACSALSSTHSHPHFINLLVVSVYFLVLNAYISYLIEVFKSQALSTARQRQFRESRQRRSEQGFTTPTSTLQQGRLLAEPRLASCFIWSSDESNAR